MTVIELRLFFESLPDSSTVKKGRAILSKKDLALDSGVQLVYIRRVIAGEKPLTPYIEGKLLPIMRKYGFMG